MNALPAIESRPLLRRARRRPPLVPEYKCFLRQAPVGSEYRLLDSKGGASGSSSLAPAATFAVYHSKEEFVQKAISARHPFLDSRPVDDKVKENAFFIMTQRLSAIAKVRISAKKSLFGSLRGPLLKQEAPADTNRRLAHVILDFLQTTKGAF